MKITSSVLVEMYRRLKHSRAVALWWLIYVVCSFLGSLGGCQGVLVGCQDVLGGVYRVLFGSLSCSRWFLGFNQVVARVFQIVARVCQLVAMVLCVDIAGIFLFIVFLVERYNHLKSMNSTIGVNVQAVCTVRQTVKNEFLI